MKLINIQAVINAPKAIVWEYWTKPEHVKNWNFASPDWCCPDATNNLAVGGEFHYTMAAKDQSMSFDFWGTYQKIETQKSLEILLGDGRFMKVDFETNEHGTLVMEAFEPENQNPEEMQEAGWQMILNNFKKYVEENQ